MFDPEALDEFIKAQEAKDAFSGAVLVAHNREPVFREAYGFANRRYEVPNRVDTKFNLGSINKIFTKVAITQLVQEGLVAYDDLVGKFLPDFPAQIADKVIVRHLLTHTSGMGHYWNQRFVASLSNLRTVDDFLLLFIDEPLAFEPGTKREYSNAGYVVLGKIVEVMSGRDYYDYVRENVYLPAGMRNTDHYELDDPIPNLAVGYTRGWGTPDQMKERRENTFAIGSKGSPAGGGYSTLDDMLRFDTALEENRLLSPEYSSTILRPLDSTEVSLIAFLAGGAPGVAAFFIKYHRTGYTIIVLSNYDPDDVEPVTNKIQELLE